MTSLSGELRGQVTPGLVIVSSETIVNRRKEGLADSRIKVGKEFNL